jgi:hypothetical protein
MSISDLGSVGEFIASIGVVVSLLYLALQTRANTNALKSQTRSSITDQILSVQIATFHSAEFIEASEKDRLAEPLTDKEQYLLRREAVLYFKHMENAQYQYETGLYDSAEYAAQRAIWVQRFTNQRYWREAWEAAESTLSPRLVAEVRPILDGIDIGENI